MAKTFSCRPSDYLPELNTWEAFCLDETIAYHLAKEEQRMYDDAKAGKGQRGQENKKDNRPSSSDNAIDVLNHEAFRKK